MRLARGAALLVLGYLGVVGLFGAMETALLFPAPRLGRDWLSASARRYGASEVEIRAEDDVGLYGWRMTATAGERGLVVVFDGNGSSVGLHPALYDRFRATGFAVLHVNYRGYPGSEGSPSEEGLRADARASWAEALRYHSPGEVVLYGKSLGGAVALGLAADVLPRAVVVESTFTSAARVGQESYPFLPVRWMMRNRFESLALAPRVRCPALVIHGEFDEMIGVAHGRDLAAALPHATFVGVAGGLHNDDLLADAAAWRAFEEVAGGG